MQGRGIGRGKFKLDFKAREVKELNRRWLQLINLTTVSYDTKQDKQ